MNRAQIIIFSTIGVIIFVALLIVMGVIPGVRPRPPEEVTLVVWGFEDEELWREIAARYGDELKHVTIFYQQKLPESYEAELLNALASGKGPDIFTLKNTQISGHKDKIGPLPQDLLSYRVRDFKNAFFDAAALDLITAEGDIIGLPLTVDTLALFYNRDFFNSANVASPPRTWSEFVDAVSRLTSYSEAGIITRSGAAMGTAANVEHAVDILSGLMMQYGVDLVDRETRASKLAGNGFGFGAEGPAGSALNFYASFADSVRRTYTWSSFFTNSLSAFAQGRTAMIFGYAADVPTVVEKNPHLNFGVSEFPQQDDGAVTTYHARFMFEAVSKQSQNPEEAWRFLLWLSGKENDKLFADSLGLAPARRDLVNAKPPADYLDVFYGQVLASKTWLIPDEKAIHGIFEEMINSVVNKSASVGTAVDRAHRRLNNFLNPPL